MVWKWQLNGHADIPRYVVVTIKLSIESSGKPEKALQNGKFQFRIVLKVEIGPILRDSASSSLELFTGFITTQF